MSCKIGDVVELNSGGPSMTVKCLDDEIVICTWFKDGVITEGNFPHDALIHHTISGSA